MNLSDLMARHARRDLTRLNQCGEPVTWHFADGSPDREFRAVIDRQLLEPMNGIGVTAGAVRGARVWVPRDSTSGVERVVEGDDVTVRLRIGYPPARCRVVETLSEDEGGFLVQVLQ